MAYDHEYDNVMMKIGNGAGAMVYLGTASFRATAKLVQFIARLVKQKILNKGVFRSFNQFVKLTEGKFDIVNVPLEDALKVDGLTADMKRVGIRHYVMPDLDKGDGFTQIAIMRDDAQKFNALYERYILNTLDGGKMSLRDLSNFTNGKISLVSIPYNDTDKESLHNLQDDLDKLKINYTVMPDLKVGDGKVQLSVASADLPKLQHWFDLYRADLLQAGVDIGVMEQMSMEQYTGMGKVTPDQYMSTATPEIKEKVAVFDQKEKGACEQAIDRMDNRIKDVSDERYDILKNDPDFIEVTIDRQNVTTSPDINPSPRAAQYFYSKVPGTDFGNELTLCLPKNHVFYADDGQAYRAFINKDQKPAIFNRFGSLMQETERCTGKELFHKYYEITERNSDSKSKEVLTKAIKEAAKTAEKAIKAPMPPVVAK